MLTIALPSALKTANAHDIRAELLEMLEQKPDAITLDCSALKEIDSTGLSVFIAFIGAIHKQQPNCTVTVAHTSTVIRRLLTIAHLDRIHPITFPEES